MLEKIKSAIRGSVEFLGGAATTVVAFMLANLGCKVLVAMFVISAVIALATIKSSRYTKRGKVVIIAVSAIVLMLIGVYHKNNFHNIVKEDPALTASEVNTTEEKTEEETTVATEEDVKEDTFVRNYLDDSERKECIDIQVTKKSTENIETGKVEVEGETTTVINNSETTATNDDLIIDQAKEDDSKEVTEMEEGITAVTEKVTEEEKSEEAAEVEEVVEETKAPEKIELSEEVVEEITSEENKDEEINEKVETLVEEETEKEEDFADMSSEELESLFVETTTETVTVVETVVEVEDVEIETEVETETPVIDVENVEKQEIIEDEVIVEDIVDIEDETTEEVEVEDVVEVEDIVVEEVEVVEAVSVTAIDGYTTVVGSQIQFQVSGDDVVIEGLDGINYTFSNGILTIDAGSEATVISVCVSNSVNAVDFNITVNGIIG